ncbi:unnamed protein product [Amoebophrya sp. A25]|nr:unnamed protein product [Amoebophrya sp. A25]|eukprot:GSA25T00009907001.1
MDTLQHLKEISGNSVYNLFKADEEDGSDIEPDKVVQGDNKAGEAGAGGGDTTGNDGERGVAAGGERTLTLDKKARRKSMAALPTATSASGASSQASGNKKSGFRRGSVDVPAPHPSSSSTRGKETASAAEAAAAPAFGDATVRGATVESSGQKLKSPLGMQPTVPPPDKKMISGPRRGSRLLDAQPVNPYADVSAGFSKSVIEVDMSAAAQPSTSGQSAAAGTTPPGLFGQSVNGFADGFSGGFFPQASQQGIIPPFGAPPGFLGAPFGRAPPSFFSPHNMAGGVPGFGHPFPGSPAVNDPLTRPTQQFSPEFGAPDLFSGDGSPRSPPFSPSSASEETRAAAPVYCSPLGGAGNGTTHPAQADSNAMANGAFPPGVASSILGHAGTFPVPAAIPPNLMAAFAAGAMPSLTHVPASQIPESGNWTTTSPKGRPNSGFDFFALGEKNVQKQGLEHNSSPSSGTTIDRTIAGSTRASEKVAEQDYNSCERGNHESEASGRRNQERNLGATTLLQLSEEQVGESAASDDKKRAGGSTASSQRGAAKKHFTPRVLPKGRALPPEAMLARSVVRPPGVGPKQDMKDETPNSAAGGTMTSTTLNTAAAVGGTSTQHQHAVTGSSGSAIRAAGVLGDESSACSSASSSQQGKRASKKSLVDGSSSGASSREGQKSKSSARSCARGGEEAVKKATSVERRKSRGDARAGSKDGTTSRVSYSSSKAVSKNGDGSKPSSSASQGSDASSKTRRSRRESVPLQSTTTLPPTTFELPLSGPQTLSPANNSISGQIAGRGGNSVGQPEQTASTVTAPHSGNNATSNYGQDAAGLGGLSSSPNVINKGSKSRTDLQHNAMLTSVTDKSSRNKNNFYMQPQVPAPPAPPAGWHAVGAGPPAATVSVSCTIPPKVSSTNIWPAVSASSSGGLSTTIVELSTEKQKELLGGAPTKKVDFSSRSPKVASPRVGHKSSSALGETEQSRTHDTITNQHTASRSSRNHGNTGHGLASNNLDEEVRLLQNLGRGSPKRTEQKMLPQMKVIEGETVLPSRLLTRKRTVDAKSTKQ